MVVGLNFEVTSLDLVSILFKLPFYENIWNYYNFTVELIGLEFEQCLSINIKKW